MKTTFTLFILASLFSLLFGLKNAPENSNSPITESNLYPATSTDKTDILLPSDNSKGIFWWSDPFLLNNGLGLGFDELLLEDHLETEATLNSNLFNERILIEWTGYFSVKQIRLINVVGKTIAEQDVDPSSEYSEFILPYQLASGIYLIQLLGAHEVYSSKKLTIE